MTAMTPFTHEQTAPLCDPDFAGLDPALIGIGAVILTGPRRVFEHATGARITDAGALQLRRSRDGSRADAPKTVRVA